MKKPTNPTVSFTCRLRVDVMELIRNLALQGKISQAAIITNALECMVNNHTNEIPHNALAELKMQILEKDQLINKLVSNQTELIRQNDQGQQLLASFTLIGEGAKLLEQGKKKQNKKGREVERTKGSPTSKKKNKNKKGKKNKR
jgi:hypothetical protein